MHKMRKETKCCNKEVKFSEESLIQIFSWSFLPHRQHHRLTVGLTSSTHIFPERIVSCTVSSFVPYRFPLNSPNSRNRSAWISMFIVSRSVKKYFFPWTSPSRGALDVSAINVSTECFKWRLMLWRMCKSMLHPMRDCRFKTSLFSINENVSGFEWKHFFHGRSNLWALRWTIKCNYW